MRIKKTKIVCTIGPSSWDPETLTKLAKAGMDVARLNMSHGSHEEKKQQIKLIRQISENLNKPLGIIADLQGPKIRLGDIDGTKIIKKGDLVHLSLSPADDEFPIQFDLTPFVKKGQRIFLNDGLVELVISELRHKTILAKAQNDGWVSSHKGVNIPDTRLRGGVFTDKDKEDAEFALDEGVDYLAVSFIQTPEDLKEVKDLIKKNKSKTKLITKVEKGEALVHLEEIVKESDAVMVARGDLGIEIPASEVPIFQEKMIRLCRQYHKPVIIATQMLESMTQNPRPTRAETSDVANAVLDQVDAVMLSAESASGRYPVEAVETMHSIILSVEEHPDYKHYIKIDWQNVSLEELSFSAIVSSAASLAYRINAKYICTATATGRTPRLLSAFRPGPDIVALTHDIQNSNQLSLVWGVNPLIVKPTKTFNAFLDNVIDSIKENEDVKKGDKIVVVTGAQVGISGMTDTIRVITI